MQVVYFVVQYGQVFGVYVEGEVLEFFGIDVGYVQYVWVYYVVIYDFQLVGLFVYVVVVVVVDYVLNVYFG